MLYSNGKEQTATTRNNTDESHKLNIEQKMPHVKEHILHDSIDGKFKNRRTTLWW